MKTTKKRSDCPLSNSLEVFGDKWSLLIIRDLFFNKECTYGDFIKSEEKIATNILATRLISLEENGIIDKLEYPNNKVKVLYKLTNKGVELLPVIIEIILWAEKYYSLTPKMESLIQEVKKDKSHYLQTIMKELMN